LYRGDQPPCHDALKGLPHRDRLSFRVTPHDLIVDETTIGAGTVIEHELTRRLFRARVANLDIDRAATPRDLSRFCINLVGADDLEREGITFAERLTEHGVTAITVGMAHRPAVLDIGNPAPATQDVLTPRTATRESLAQRDAPISYLYPPDKGWVRLDPGQTIESVSLVDLVVLVEDPADIASMLLRLTDDEIPGVDTRQTALERKFSDVTLLFSALDPRLAQVMFGRLARAVLKLDPDRRNNLLQRTVLPGLLDGKDEGKVLRDFPTWIWRSRSVSCSISRRPHRKSSLQRSIDWTSRPIVVPRSSRSSTNVSARNTAARRSIDPRASTATRRD
jgi:hypothetical protein